MARVSLVICLTLALLNTALGLAVESTTSLPKPTTAAPKVDEIDPLVDDVKDVADVQNAEDDPELFQVTCGENDEYLADPRNCGRFYQCANGVPVQLRCPNGLYFDLANRVCDYPQNVDCRNPRDRCSHRRIGRPSGSGDDDVSVATCPRGTFVVGCSASNPRRSDGTNIDGQECRAVNSAGGDGQRAVAVCVSGEEGEYVVVTSGSWEREPEARCPVNYRIVNCLLRNAWNQGRFAFPYTNAGRGSCSADTVCSSGQGCTVQAVCRRVNFPVDVAEGY